MLVILNNFSNFRFLELIAEITHLKYMTWILEKFQEVCSTNSWMIDSKSFTGPDHPEWHIYAFVAYFKDKLYYLGGEDPKTGEDTDRVDVRISNESLWNDLFRF